MNIEYIGIEGAVLDNAFTGSETLVNLLNKRLKDDNFLNEFVNPGFVDGKYFYRTFDLLEGEVDYKVGVESLHESGLVIRLTCMIDAGINKYNTASSGLLILKDLEVPKFIITGIDAHQNSDLASDDDVVWTIVNKDKTEKLINDLGKRIDETYLVGVKPKDTFLTKAHNHKKTMEVKNELFERLGSFMDYVDSFGYSEEIKM